MKPGLFGQHLTLTESLKAATFAAHAGLQTAPYFSALAACQLPLESYVGQLRALAILHSALETALAACPDARVAAVWARDREKFALLQQDLRYFEPRAVADLREATEAALSAAEHLKLLALERPLALLGVVYVLEGSTLGAAVVRPLVARAFLLTGTDGLAYLHAYGDAAPVQWKKFRDGLNALTLTPAEQNEIIAAAVDFFARLERIFRALYPFAPESRTILVTSINPEAGRHAVPADPREVAAAIRAGDQCWERWPYFPQRYGERGLRFARSDAAWKATLCHYEPAQISQQIRWLGRVLAGRGMPTVLLQDQLVALVNELTAVFPERQSVYEKLLPAAAELLAARRQYLPDDRVAELCAAFDRAVGPAWAARLPGTGTLLACAVADECSGSPLAVTSLQSWLTDATRFPPVWIAAVAATLAVARAHAAQLSVAHAAPAPP
jgi:heme oxygenase